MQANAYYPEPPTDVTGGLPITLDSLRDGPPGSKPFYPTRPSFGDYAIKGSPNQKLLLEDIYYAIESRFPYFRTAPSGWKNSVRHNLSLNPCFEKVARPLTDRGKGSYWTVNDNVDPRTGVHRVRKKKPKTRRGQSRPLDDADEYQPQNVPPQYENPAQYVPAPPMDPNDPGPSRPGPYPPPYPPFDPAAFAMMGPPPGMRFPVPPIPQVPMEEFELDEHGNVNWHAAWEKELSALQQLTDDQEKAGVEQEWYRQMLFRVRAALMMAFPPDHMGGGPPPPPMEPRTDGDEMAHDGLPPA
ncbi:hypothetical protein BC834DRAFT_1021574 [Gloeopeniophorella convolvens]|nr:hypothetical protein BC834DRAFT_1021574 [Gloeopeniophorella convolvens]